MQTTANPGNQNYPTYSGHGWLPARLIEVRVETSPGGAGDRRFILADIIVQKKNKAMPTRADCVQSGFSQILG
jgi:hypothetical protein